MHLVRLKETVDVTYYLLIKAVINPLLNELGKLLKSMFKPQTMSD
jgi:hypothetical protein